MLIFWPGCDIRICPTQVVSGRVSTLQRTRPVRTVEAAPAYRRFLSELLSFGFVGVIGTLIMILGANV